MCRATQCLVASVTMSRAFQSTGFSQATSAVRTRQWTFSAFLDRQLCSLLSFSPLQVNLPFGLGRLSEFKFLAGQTTVPTLSSPPAGRWGGVAAPPFAIRTNAMASGLIGPQSLGGHRHSQAVAGVWQQRPQRRPVSLKSQHIRPAAPQLCREQRLCVRAQSGAVPADRTPGKLQRANCTKRTIQTILAGVLTFDLGCRKDPPAPFKGSTARGVCCQAVWY